MYLLIWTPIWRGGGGRGGQASERNRFGAVLIEPLVFLSAWRPEWRRREARRLHSPAGLPSPSLSESDLARLACPTTCHSWASLNCMSTRHISWAWEEGRTDATSTLLRSPYELNLIGTPATVFASVQPTEANRGLT